MKKIFHGVRCGSCGHWIMHVIREWTLPDGRAAAELLCKKCGNKEYRE